MESSSGDRIIVLVDMDCFYVQVEQKLCPEYQSKPCAVAQYRTWKGGGIIAVNYEARAKGVTRMMRGDEAKEKCPDIHLFRVPEVRGKADLTKYREAGALVIDVLSEFSDCVERASIDEAYIDMTSVISSRIQNTPPVTADQLPNTFVIGYEGKDPESRKNELQKWLQIIYEEEHLYNDRMLAVAAVIVEEMRAAVYEKTGYKCSAGVAHNKMLAKLSCGINKPNKQTVIPQSSIQLLFKTMPITKVRNLGGKLGGAVRTKFNAENMGDLINVPKSQFVNHFGEKTGHWLYNLVRGIENEPVTSRQLPKSIGCGKNFPGKGSLSTRDEVTYWLKQLATELEERLIKDQNNNRRFARLLTVSIRNNERGYSLVSRSCPIHVYEAEKLAHDAFTAIGKLNTSTSDTLWRPNIYTLSIVASKFEDRLVNYCNIQSFLINKSTERKDVVSNEEGSTSSTSTASFSIASNRKTEESLNRTVLKSPKNSDHSSKSITSFFARKQMAEIASVENVVDVSIKEHQSLNQKEDQSSSDGLTMDDASEILLADNIINEKEVCVEENSEGLTEKPVKSVGFFAKRLAEPSEFNFDIRFETSCDMDSMNNEQLNKENEVSLLETGIQSMPSTSSVSDICLDLDPEKCCAGHTDNINNEKEVCVEENSEGLTEKPVKSVGFFAKRLAERSAFNCDIRFATSCDMDSMNGVQLNKENEVSLLETGIQSMPLTSSVSDICLDLDPELTKLCDQCKKQIPIWEEMEHLDYHMALNLSNEIRKPFVTNSSVISKSLNVGKSTATSKSKGRGKKRGSNTKSSSQAKKASIQKNTLDAFIK